MEEEKASIVLNAKMENCNVTSAPVAQHISQVVNVNSNSGRDTIGMQTASVSQTADYSQKLVQQHQPEQPKVGTDAIRLRNYCDDDTSWNKYQEAIRACKTATELANVVVDMERSQDKLMGNDSTKGCFLDIIVSLATGIESGRTVGNVRQRIYTAQGRKKNR